MKSLALAAAAALLCTRAVAQPLPMMPARGSWARIGDVPDGSAPNRLSTA